ncbi:hypothetical protein G7054_g9133 [Neopestalotiopsis clavispora]|nr:hypothetical protein G7054_g9133 [Neopestalotiopsis clavispora]
MLKGECGMNGIAVRRLFFQMVFCKVPLENFARGRVLPTVRIRAKFTREGPVTLLLVQSFRLGPDSCNGDKLIAYLWLKACAIDYHGTPRSPDEMSWTMLSDLDWHPVDWLGVEIRILVIKPNRHRCILQTMAWRLMKAQVKLEGMSRTAGKNPQSSSSTERVFHDNEDFWQPGIKSQKDGQGNEVTRARRPRVRSPLRPPPPPPWRPPAAANAKQPSTNAFDGPPRLSQFPPHGAPRFNHLGQDSSQNPFSAQASSSMPTAVDGVWDPSQSKNVTVQLNLDISEDIGQEIEIFCRLYKMGSFVKARSYFDENLAVHLNKPYIFVMYAEMLLRQGSHYEICDLDDHVVKRSTERPVQQIHLRSLQGYWETIQLIAQTENGRSSVLPPGHIIGSLQKDLNHLLIVDTNNTIGSIEVGMICALLRAQYLYPDLVSWSLTNLALRPVYERLLREGRVWDMHDLLGAFLRWGLGSIDDPVVVITGYSYATEGLSQIVKDWTGLGTEDVPTMLALLDLLTMEALRCLHYQDLEWLDEILDHATPLAVSLAKRDATLTKTRAYTQWIVAKACSIVYRNPRMLDYQGLLKSNPGIAIVDGLFLPKYIPVHSENPGWPRPETSQDIVKTIKLAINNARDLGDYETEHWALTQLIMISKAPSSEFEDLCELQHQIQGQVTAYMGTLLSMYLVCSSEQSKLKLKLELEELVSSHEFEQFPLMLRWEAHMICHALEQEESRAEQALKAADDCAKSFDDSMLAAIKAKIPDFQEQVHQRRSARRRESEVDNVAVEQLELDNKRTAIDTRQSELDMRRRNSNAQQKKPVTYRRDKDTPQTIPVTDELGLILHPFFPDGTKRASNIENMHDDKGEEEEVAHGNQASKHASTSVQGHGEGVDLEQPQEVPLIPTESNTSAGRQYAPYNSLATRFERSRTALQQGDDDDWSSSASEDSLVFEDDRRTNASINTDATSTHTFDHPATSRKRKQSRFGRALKENVRNRLNTEPPKDTTKVQFDVPSSDTNDSRRCTHRQNISRAPFSPKGERTVRAASLTTPKSPNELSGETLQDVSEEQQGGKGVEKPPDIYGIGAAQERADDTNASLEREKEKNPQKGDGEDLEKSSKKTTAGDIDESTEIGREENVEKGSEEKSESTGLGMNLSISPIFHQSVAPTAEEGDNDGNDHD